MYLNEQLINDFRDLIDSSPIFCKDENYRPKWNFICAFLDRIDSCVNVLNREQFVTVKTEIDFIMFLTYGSIISESVKLLLKVININWNKLPKTSYFNDEIKKGTSDYNFFEYLRSLVFAHPLETNRAKVLISNNEVQYSPFVIAGSFYDYQVGFRVYSSLDQEGLKDIVFPYSEIKEYIKYKYEQISLGIAWAHRVIKEFTIKWSERKVVNDTNPISVLEDIIEIFKERYLDCYKLDIIKQHLQFKSEFNDNEKSIQTYQQALIENIPEIVVLVNEVKTDHIYECKIFQLLHCRPIDLPKGARYQLKEIYTSTDLDWKEAQLNNFYESYAKEYVVIDKGMSWFEKTLLVNVALFLAKHSSRKQ